MAYDPNSSYEPPRRAYYGQEQQQAPVRHHDYHGPAQDQYGDYEHQAQGYGYGQDYNTSHNQYGYEEDQRGIGGQQRYDSGYDGDFNKQPRGREPPPRQGYKQAYANPPAMRGPGPRGAYDNPRQRPRPPPERQYQPQPNGQSRPPDSRGGRGPEDRPNRRPVQPQPPPHGNLAHPPRGASRPREPKMTTEEWKSQERVKMNAPKSPDVLAQDNAFPTFPSSRPTSRPEESSSLSHRPGEAQQRSSNSSSRHPPMHRGNSYEQSAAPAWSRHDSDPQANGYNSQSPYQPSYEQRPSYREQPRDPAPQHYEEPHAAQPRFSASEYAQDYATEIHNPYQSPAYGSRQEPPRPKTANASRPVPRPIDTSFTQDMPRPGYMNHNPMSPAAIPPRPSTSHGARAPGPPSPYAAKPYAQQGPADRHSLDDVLNDYGAMDPEPHVPRPPQRAMTRDEEIESEMPDFDSAAPNQSKGLHNRPHPPNHDVSVQAGPYANNGFHDQRSEHVQSQPRVGSARNGGTPAPSNGYEGFDFGVAGNSQHSGPAVMPEPPRAPFATEPLARRSFDDARQMPHRAGPPQGPLPNRPGQRGPPTGPYMQGAFPHHMRPDMDRSQSAGPMQPSPMGYGQARADTAPPPRPGSGSTAFAPRTGSLPGTGPSAQPPGQMSNPNALPHHPVPVRPGLMEQGNPQPSKAPPVRNHDQVPSSQPPPPTPEPSEEARPVTQAELGQLRAAVEANPNSPRQALTLVKKLAEAATVLASEGGRADPKTVTKNRERYTNEAYKRLKKLVTAGYPEAMFYMADCFGSGELGLENDPKEAFTLYQAAAKAGHAASAFRTAVCCEIGPEDGGGTRKDYPKAVQWYRRAAALGDVAGMYKIGAILLKGLLGQEKHLGEAVNWLKRSAERADAENPHALHELGLLYDPNNTTPEVRNKIIADENYARELFEKAARFGHKPSQFRMGQAYEYGSLGLPIDNRASIAWYSKAASQGEHNAELALSGWYLTGADGILQQSDTEAYLWARKAAASEPPLGKAMFAMGYFSEQGIGCPPNLDEARRWYGRAASYKFPKAHERLEELKHAKSGKGRPIPAGGKLTRKDQKRDEAECVVM